MSYSLNYDNADTIKYNYLDGVKVSIQVIVGNTVYGIPLKSTNTDYQEILEWAKIDGNTIADAD